METGANRGNLKGRVILCSFAWAECPEKNELMTESRRMQMKVCFRLFDFSTRMDQYQNEVPR